MNFFKHILGYPTFFLIIYLNNYQDQEISTDLCTLSLFPIKTMIPVNMLYSYYIYCNRFYYLNATLDYILNFKLFIQKIFKKEENDKFYIGHVQLYTDLENSIEVTLYFKKNKITRIDKDLIKNIYADYMIDFYDNKHIRLKIFYRFKGNNYIMYFPYSNTEYIPYPPYSKEVMVLFKDDIVVPTHIDILKKKYIYPLFSIECADILSVKLNGNEEIPLLNYFNKIKGPFNDFGILYNTPILLNWILTENMYNIKDFETLYVKFLNVYFDEIDFELKEHYIEMNKEMLNNIIISKRIDNILLDKKNDLNKII